MFLEVLGAGGRGAETTVLLEVCTRLDKKKIDVSLSDNVNLKLFSMNYYVNVK